MAGSNSKFKKWENGKQQVWKENYKLLQKTRKLLRVNKSYAP